MTFIIYLILKAPFMKKLSLPVVFVFALLSLSGTTRLENSYKEPAFKKSVLQCGPFISMDNLTSYAVTKVIIYNAAQGWSYTFNNPTFPLSLPTRQSGGWVDVIVQFTPSGPTGSLYAYDDILDEVVGCEEYGNHYATMTFFGDCSDYTIYISTGGC
jgi:hypothetical protein